MSRDGSGTYNRVVADYVFDTVISEVDVNAEMNDIAQALTNSIASDGQTVPTANLPMGSFKHTGVANASARTEYAATGQVQDGAFVWCGTAGGTKNALTLTTSPAIGAYAAGQKFRFKAGATASDDAVTIAVSGLTAKAAQFDDAALSVSVFIEASKYYEALYDGTAFQLTRLSGNGQDVVRTTGAQTIAGLKTFGDGIATDSIAEETAAAGVTVDGVLLKDNSVVVGAGGSVTTDTINEKTGSAGVTIDGKQIKDNDILGVSTNSSAAAGFIGEFVSASVVSGSAVSLTNATNANITSISLTAGDWDLSAIFGVGGNGATTVSYVIGSISSTSATIDGTLGRRLGVVPKSDMLATANANEFSLVGTRVSLSGTTTIYLVLQVGFAVSTCTGYGLIQARRVR